MKIALLGDTHFGARGDSVSFRDHFFKFYDDVFFPYLEDNGIDTVIQLGDLMDRRKFVNYQTLFLMKEKFISRFENTNLQLHVIVGNHDTYFRHTNSVNSLNELFDDIENVHVYQKIEERNFEGKKIIFMPWINKENYEDSMSALKNSTADILVGHLEIEGFEMHRGMPGHGGLDSKLFSRFDSVYSGHYHCKSNSGNISYLGTPYELTWSDYNDPKGFHVLDTKTDVLTYVRNPYNMFHKIFYNDEETDYKKFDVSTYKDSIVRLIVVSQTDDEMYENLLERFNNVDMVDFQITNSSLAYREEDIDDIEVEDPLSVLYKHVDLIENIDIDKKILRRYVSEIYSEALEEDNNK